MEKVIFQILKNGKMKEINGYCTKKMDGFRLKIFRLRKVMNGLLMMLMIMLAEIMIRMFGTDTWMKIMNIAKKLKMLLKKILIVGRTFKVLL